MWIILSLGLFPLGIVAIVASIDNARANRAKAEIEAQALLAQHVQRFSLALSRNATTIRAARDAIIEARDPVGICRRTLDRLGRQPNTSGRFALYGREPVPRCSTGGFVPPPAPTARGAIAQAKIMPGATLLEIFLFDPSGSLEGVAEYRREVLADLIGTPTIAGDYAVELVQEDRVMPLRTMPAAAADRRQVVVRHGFPDFQYSLQIRVAAPAASLSEILLVLTPLLMWLWASLVGWIIVQRLLLRPLARIQRIISAYNPGDQGVDLPAVSSPAAEIGALGQAFAQVTRTVARHEADLEAAVVRQARLVREVHHRVKNNLQVVASLLNLHSRGSPNEDVAAAYASIQRRVDALAVVHRNHYAELEENRGVGLKPLITELTANLRATAPPKAAGMQIRLYVGPFYVTQDVAVSVAFLITEIAEFGMLCGAALVSIMLDGDGPGSARLSIEVDSLVGAPECDEALQDRFERIITGLARQLRSTLERDPERGRYALSIAVVERAEG